MSSPAAFFWMPNGYAGCRWWASVSTAATTEMTAGRGEERPQRQPDLPQPGDRGADEHGADHHRRPVEHLDQRA